MSGEDDKHIGLPRDKRDHLSASLQPSRRTSVVQGQSNPAHPEPHEQISQTAYSKMAIISEPRGNQQRRQHHSMLKDPLDRGSRERRSNASSGLRTVDSPAWVHAPIAKLPREAAQDKAAVLDLEVNTRLRESNQNPGPPGSENLRMLQAYNKQLTSVCLRASLHGRHGSEFPHLSLSVTTH